MIKLVVTSQNSGNQRSIDIDKYPFTIGRSFRSDLRLNDKGVSKNHAVIEQTAAGIQLVDLGSRNGVLIGGNRVNQISLNSNMTFQIGHTVFRALVDDSDIEPTIEIDLNQLNHQHSLNRQVQKTALYLTSGYLLISINLVLEQLASYNLNEFSDLIQTGFSQTLLLSGVAFFLSLLSRFHARAFQFPKIFLLITSVFLIVGWLIEFLTIAEFNLNPGNFASRGFDAITLGALFLSIVIPLRIVLSRIRTKPFYVWSGVIYATLITISLAVSKIEEFEEKTNGYEYYALIKPVVLSHPLNQGSPETLLGQLDKSAEEIKLKVSSAP